MSITKKAMIVKLHISSWKGQIKDPTAAKSAQQQHGAMSGTGVYNKFLVAKNHMKAIQRAENDARRIHQKMTLPWNDGGDRLLPSKNFIKYNKQIRGAKASFETAVSKFCAQYPSMITQAKSSLGKLYAKSEYPDPSFIKDRFAFFTDVTPVPDAGDFRVDMEKVDQKKIKQDLQEKSERSHKQAMDDLYNRLYGVVETMAKGMAGQKGKVFDAYIDNIVELTEILPDLNIADDPVLNDMAKEVRDQLTAHTPGQLRKDKKLKDDTVVAAENIMNKMSGVMGGTNATQS